jgi:hypothetical protein
MLASTGTGVFCWAITPTAAIIVKQQNGFASQFRSCKQELLFYNSGMETKRGRPPTNPADSLSKITAIRLTPSERADCERAAQRAGVKLSEWIRERAVRAARRSANS